MFSYYGTKKRISKFYPKPLYDTIIEPFCGAAQYSLYGDNWKKDVILNDKYRVIYDVWNFLINKAEKSDILSLPNMSEGDKIDNYNLSYEEKLLIGFCINSASSQPKKTVAKYNSWNKTKIDIANNLYKIKHWKVFNKDYNELYNEKATWFIDPPYEFGGEWYNSKVNSKHIDYDKLSEWCKAREGQVIVCENSKASWLDFKPLIEMNGQLHKTTEVIWTNIKKEKPINMFFG